MFPSQNDPLFGVFVKNFKKKLEKAGIVFSSNSLIKGKSSSIIKKSKSYIVFYASVFKNYRKDEFDLIYVHYLTHNTPILLVINCLFKKKKPLVINVHGSDVIKAKGKFIDRFNRVIVNRCDLLIAPSEYFKNILLQQYTGINSDKIFVSPSGGINTNVFYKTDKIANAKLSLGMVSRIDFNKGWDDFLYALKELKDKGVFFKAKIAGSGNDDEKLKSLLSELKLNDDVIFVGLIEQTELVNFYNSLDVLIFPSKLPESLGLVGLEAMSCGLPVIGSNIAGIKTYVIDEVNGFLFSPGSIPELVKSILKYNALPEETKKLFSQKAINTARSYDSEVVTNNMISKLREYVS